MSPIPFVDLSRAMEPIRTDIERAISNCIDRSAYLRGPETRAFEEEWAEFCGQSYAVCCNSGTDAISLAALALDLKTAEIQSNTLPLTGIGLHRGGARVSIAEIDEAGWLAEPNDQSVPVLLYGRIPPDTQQNARLYDAAHAHGWRPPDKSVAAWSFYPTKTLGALGDGGAITTNDRHFATEMRDLCGRDDRFYDGRQMTSRMDEIQSAVLRVKLRHLPNWLEQRQELGAIYRMRLGPMGLTLPGLSLEHLFCIRHSRRAELSAFLEARAIATKIHWREPLHQLNGPWRADASYANAEEWSRTVLSLPMFPGLTCNEVNRVCDAIEEFALSSSQK